MYLVGVATSQCDLKIWGLWSLINIIIGSMANSAVHARMRHDSVPFTNFLANGFAAVSEKQNSIILMKMKILSA